MTDRTIIGWGAVLLICGCAASAAFGLLPSLVAIVLLPLLVVIPGSLVMEILNVTCATVGVRLIYSAAGSIAILIFTGLVLNLLPPGLTVRTWNIAMAAELAILIVGNEILARSVRQQRFTNSGRQLWTWGSLARAKAGSPSSEGGRHRRHRLVTPQRSVLTIATVLLVVGAFVLSNWSANVHRESFTALYGQSSEGMLLIGVRSYEAQTVQYELRIGGGSGLEKQFALRSGVTRNFEFLDDSVYVGESRVIDVKLYVKGSHHVYRWLRLYRSRA